MNEKSLKNISLILAIIGIFLLTIISNFQQPTNITLNQLNSSYLNKEVQFLGKLTHIKETPGLFILSFRDNNGSITGIIYKEENLTFQVDKLYEVTGKIITYKKI
jgi:hypothetical protein